LCICAGKAHEPLGVRQLGGEIACRSELQIGCDRLARDHLHGRRGVQVVAHSSDADGILTRFQPVPRKPVTALLVADDGDRPRRASPTHADKHAFGDALVG
jgi:hypothetical protein